MKRVLIQLAVILDRMLARLSPRRRVYGVDLVVSDPNADIVEFFDKCTSALRMLAEKHPHGLRMVTRYLAHIELWPGSYTAFDRRGGMHISYNFFSRSSIELLASGIVHEAVHVRIKQRKIEYQEHLRERIEAICVREQANTLRALGKQDLADAAVDCLAQPWWTPEALMHDVDTSLAQVGTPAAVGRLVKWLRRF